MKKKKKLNIVQRRKLTKFFPLAILIITGIILVLFFYFAFREDPYFVKESKLVQNPILKQELTYQTKFCASQLTLLLNEIHFIEKEISGEEKVLGGEKAVQTEEAKLLPLKKIELQKVTDKFNNYKKACDSFDLKPTLEVCQKFLLDSQQYITQWQQKSQNSSFWTKLKIIVGELRKAKNIHKELQKRCAKLK